MNAPCEVKASDTLTVSDACLFFATVLVQGC
ncbi:hypothetical protein U14_04644 [Candidatus Moduliflexus flocculans]|uniref:Uncharacterized protein n=1 Tax=Candidatus Moduliflexus flocculans TaxID=1499966 RepID=A0A0S6W5I2_9BACT|nr:hypothetical protein U14_04644 [Candidatus Moduliflexus flocculans]